MSKERTEAKLRALIRKGQTDAAYIWQLREACRRTLEATDGLDLALGIDPDADDVLNRVMDDAYGDFLPILVKRACGVEDLYWHVTPQLLIEAAVLGHKRFNEDAYPKVVFLHKDWKGAMQDAKSITIDGHEIEVRYVSRYQKGNTMKTRLAKMDVRTEE